MFKSSCLRNVIAIGLLFLFAAAPVRAESSTQSQADELLSIVPAESLFCVRLNNFSFTLTMADQFLADAIPMGVSMLARMQLGEILGDPMLNNVNTQGNFAVFAVIMPGESAESSPGQNVFVGGIIPLTDFQQFISGNPNCSQPDANGVSKITIDQTPGMLVTQLGSNALISSVNNYDKLISMAKSISEAKVSGLADSLDADEAKLAVNEPLWAYANIQQLSRAFGPIVFAKIEQMKTMMESMKEAGQGPMPMGNPAAIMDMYASMLKTLMNETKYFSIAVSPKPNVLNITKTIAALPGTNMANMFVADAPARQQNKLLGYLQDGAMVNFGANVNRPFLQKLYTKGFDLLALMAGDNMAADDTAKMRTLATDMVDSIGDSVACSFSIDANSRPPFSIKYIIAVRDEKKFNRVIEEQMEMMNTGAIADLYKNMGIKMSYTMKRGIDNYKGASIDSATLVFKPTEPNSPMGQMLDAMYGEGFKYRWATVDELWLCAIGGDMDSVIRELIDQVKAGGAKQLADETKAALELLPGADQNSFVGTLNLIRAFKMATAMAPMPMPQLGIPTKSNIAFTGKIGNDKMSVDIALPKEHLTEIMMGFQMMMRQQMPMPEQPQQPPIQ